MEKVRIKQIKNVFKIDSINEELNGKKFILTLNPQYLFFRKISDGNFYLLDDELLNERSEIVGWIKWLK